MDYKIGDKLTIIGNKSEHEFEIGKKVIVTETFYDNEDPNFKAESKTDYWFIYFESDVE